MRILIITSKDHPYANYLVGSLLRSDMFNDATVMVGEQRALIPGKSTADGFLCYLRTAGLAYVLAQIGKTYLFTLSRFVLGLLGKRCAPYYPYWKQADVRRVPLNHIKSTSTKNRIRDYEPELILSLFSKELLPPDVIKLPPAGCWNLHPALLPDYKGVSPTFWALADSADHTGVTLHTVDTGIDTGNIIDQVEISLHGIRSEHDLYMKCTVQGIKLLQKALQKVLQGETTETHKQAGGGGCRSLPTKQAVRTFRQNGCRFFGIKQFLVSGFSCKNTS